jgi:hypothetical protein
MRSWLRRERIKVKMTFFTLPKSLVKAHSKVVVAMAM